MQILHCHHRRHSNFGKFVAAKGYHFLEINYQYQSPENALNQKLQMYLHKQYQTKTPQVQNPEGDILNQM